MTRYHDVAAETLRAETLPAVSHNAPDQEAPAKVAALLSKDARIGP
ncbi:hypothetical protein SAMN05444920_104124 [Nonomuraea solani]|uniref:Uncharacterized protein n=1 Tax=Nonomuraea solani TaxID=1144553 RepID=A0A1H6CLJ9_9ACTN|nr:hypothetical protein [Nonomuraea solani]SEG73909.1 hypothetical protein SAMN05444920_104124 [Nonomuraea solani]